MLAHQKSLSSYSHARHWSALDKPGVCHPATGMCAESVQCCFSSENLLWSPRALQVVVLHQTPPCMTRGRGRGIQAWGHWVMYLTTLQCPGRPPRGQGGTSGSHPSPQATWGLAGRNGTHQWTHPSPDHSPQVQTQDGRGRGQSSAQKWPLPKRPRPPSPRSGF